MIEEKKGMHRAWLVFIGVCMMMAGGMGLILNVMGNYFGPMAIEFGLFTSEGKPDATQVVLLMTVYSYVMLVWLPFCGRLFDKIDARILFGAGGICVVLACALLGVWQEVWQIYISGVLLGLAGPIIFLVGPSFLINSWFAPGQAGRFLGIASAFTGVGAFVWSPLFAGFIQSMGYRTSFFIEAVLAAVLILIPAFFFFRTRPEDVGLKPYGAEKEEKGAGEEKKSGVGGKFALGTIAFYCIFVAACLISLGGGYKSMMPIAVQSIAEVGSDQYAALGMLGATMISAAAVGNVLGKITLGVLADKIGVRNSMIIFAVVNAIGFALMATMLGGAEAIMLIAGFCIGIGDAMMSVGLPLLTRQCFGIREYAKIYSYLNMGIAILGGLGATYVAVVAAFGGYELAYGLGILFEVVIIAAVIISVGTAKKWRNKWTLEGEPEKSRKAA